MNGPKKFIMFHLTRLERLPMDKYSSSLQKSVNYDRKKFYRIGPVAKNKELVKIFSLLNVDQQ